MASELRVDTLKDASGNNSVGTSFIARGSAKAWVNLDGTATFNEADDEVNDSFNLSSALDIGTGNHKITYSSAMSSVNYVCTGEGGTKSATGSHMFLCGHTKETGSSTVSNLSDGGAAADRNIHNWVVHGDLA
jgi:hypothetical protein